jgi:hypothetical protein
VNSIKKITPPKKISKNGQGTLTLKALTRLFFGANNIFAPKWGYFIEIEMSGQALSKAA